MVAAKSNCCLPLGIAVAQLSPTLASSPAGEKHQSGRARSASPPARTGRVGITISDINYKVFHLFILPEAPNTRLKSWLRQQLQTCKKCKSIVTKSCLVCSLNAKAWLALTTC